jgi:toxin ParE1/3/4
MASYRVQERAGSRIDEIYDYTLTTWGEARAEHYIRGLFAYFEAIAARNTAWRTIPAEFGVDGYFGRYEKHVVYWRVLSDGAIGIVTVLHERMHQHARLRDDAESNE